MAVLPPDPPLRPFRPGDEEAIARHADDYEVWRHLRDRFPRPYTRRDAEEWIAFTATHDPPEHFVIEDCGAPVGGIGLIPGTDVDRVSAEVGYWLGRAVWGRGLATRSLESLTVYAFRAFDFTRLFATPFDDNPASIRVLEKAGWVLEGRLRSAVVKEGRVGDLLLYAITRADALRRRGG
ncbi:MAG TPA: GNAT family protein [Thermoanaerobaculia bacterium]|nr:GNAT family protein [Thermoanaerobaculia bacterium]